MKKLEAKGSELAHHMTPTHYSQNPPGEDN